MSKKKLIVLAIVTILIGAALAAGVYLVQQQQLIRPKAVPATTMTIVAPVARPQVGDTFTVDVEIDTGENTADAVNLRLDYDPGTILAQDVTAGTFFASPGATGASVTSSTVSLDFFPPLGNSQQGSGTLATVTFLAQAVGLSEIRVSSSSIVGAYDEGQIRNVLTTTTPDTVDVEESALPTSTPTPTPAGGDTELTPTPTAAPQATATPAATGGSIVTATPTPSQLPAAGVTQTTLSVLGGALLTILLGILLL